MFIDFLILLVKPTSGSGLLCYVYTAQPVLFLPHLGCFKLDISSKTPSNGRFCAKLTKL